jgi:hypothetical protein
MALCGLACPGVGLADNKSNQASRREGVQDLANDLAANVKTFLQKRGQLGIRVGHFTGSGLDHVNAGGLLMTNLVQALGNTVQVEAPLELGGKYLLTDDPNAPNLKVILVRASITDLKTGADVKEFPEFVGYIRNATDFARLTGATVVFKADENYPGTPSQGRRLDVQDSLPPKPGEKPKQCTAFVHGSIIRSHEASLYDVEILCGPTAKGPFTPLQATLDNPQFPGVPFVEIAKGHYYQVRVVNRDRKSRLGVFLHLDGIDQFAFSEDRNPDGSPKYKLWVVDPGKDIVIRGYHKNVYPGEVYGFLTTEHGHGAASKFPKLSQGNIGTICVGLTRERARGEKGILETLPGDVIPEKQKVTEFRLGDIDEFVTIRYGR